MAYRSESNKIGNKQNYTDLNLTQYPTTLDTRLNNTNMKGFTNIGEGQIPDYVMAEFVNAALDGVMAIERALGVTPMVPYDTPTASITSTIETSSVSARIKRIENGLFDVRYGGTGWTNTANRPTLNNHNHDGLNGHPGKIHLQTEIEGLLLKKNLNLTADVGLTGADIFLSAANPIKINIALEDFLSKSKGGTVNGPVTFNKGVKTRTTADFRADEMAVLASTSLASDASTSAGTALTTSSAGTTVTLFSLSAAERAQMLFGKYICGIRVKLTGTATGNVLRFQLGTNVQTIVDTELTTGKYKQLYFVFNQDETTKANALQIQKLATASTVGIALDSVFIEPIHPAVLDR